MVVILTGYAMCPKYGQIREIMRKEDPNNESSMVFINYDCILLEIMNQWHDIGYQSIHNKSKVVNDVIQFIVEVITNYKQFFRDCAVILYHTDCESDHFDTAMNHSDQYRENYRTTFDSIKYAGFKQLYLESLYDIINMVIDSVPNVYLIKTKNIDSAMIPYSFAKEYPDRKMVVVTWDNVDVLLDWIHPNVTVVYDARKVDCISPIVDSGRHYIDRVTNAINPNHYGQFATRILLASVGNGPRSLHGIGKRPTGYDNVAQWLQRAFGNSAIPSEYSDYHCISKQISEQYRESFIESYLGMDLEYQYQMMKDSRAEILYKLDHDPVDPNEIIKLFPNIVFEWDKLYA